MADRPSLGFDVREKHRSFMVVLGSIGGRRVFGVPVYSSSERERAYAVLDAIRSGLLDKVDEAVRDEAGLPLTESQRFQVSEARDILGTWDLANLGGISRETVLADQVRALLAIIDQAFPATQGATRG